MPCYPNDAKFSRANAPWDDSEEDYLIRSWIDGDKSNHALDNSGF